MTCRHSKGDPSCSSHPDNVRRESEHRYQEELAKRDRERAELLAKLPPTPDSERYDIVDFERVGPHLVLKVLYPNCSKCSYEGNKVMVFLNVSEKDFAKWKKIDPHFRESTAKMGAIGGVPVKATVVFTREAPSPAARFPANEEGWQDALDYARKKERTP